MDGAKTDPSRISSLMSVKPIPSAHLTVKVFSGLNEYASAAISKVTSLIVLFHSHMDRYGRWCAAAWIARASARPTHS